VVCVCVQLLAKGKVAPPPPTPLETTVAAAGATVSTLFATASGLVYVFIR
jgi:hypothetical protein